MDDYKTEIKSLGEIFRNRWLHIPAYQRPYQWDKNNITDLLHDLVNPFLQDVLQYKKSNAEIQAEHGSETGWRNKPTFLGSIILTENEDHIEKKLWDVDTNKVFSIVDGQQRTITFNLILFSLIYKAFQLKGKFEEITINDSDFSGINPKIQKVLSSTLEKMYEIVGINIDTSEIEWEKKETTLNELNQVPPSEWYMLANKTNRVFREEDHPGNNNYKSELSAFLQIFIYQHNGRIDYSNYSNHIDSITELVEDACEEELENPNFHFESMFDNYFSNYSFIVSKLDDQLFENHYDDFRKYFSDDDTISRFFSEYCTILKLKFGELVEEGWRGEISQYFKDKQYNTELTEFFLLTTFFAYLTRQVHLSEIICKSPDMSLEIFTSLNTTGTDLTILETFKPLCYDAAKKESSESNVAKSDIIQKFNLIQTTYLDGEKNKFSGIEKVKHMAEIKKLIKSFMYYVKEDAELWKITGGEREQRQFLKNSLENENSYKNKVGFVNEIWKLADFKRRHWNTVVKSNTQANKFGQWTEISDEAFFFLRGLKDASFDLVIPILHKFHQDYLKIKNSSASVEIRNNALKNTNDNIITLSYFVLLYRICFNNTGGIDNYFRALINDLNLNINSKVSTKNSELREYLSHRLENHTPSPIAKGDLDSFPLWYERIKDKNMASGSSNIVFTKIINRVVSKYGVTDDKGNLNYTEDINEGNMILFKDHKSPKLRTIEHLIPQNKKDTFKEEDKKWLDSIGNICTLQDSINSSLQDKPSELKRKVFKAYTLQVDDGTRKKIEEELIQAGVTLTKVIKNIIDGKESIGRRSSYATHMALAIKVPNDIPDVIERGKQIYKIFYQVAINHVWPKK